MFSLKNLDAKPVIALRLGLGFVLIYAGASILANPESWIGYVPQWVGKIAAPETFLMAHGVFELILGVLMLTGFFLPIASLILFLDMGTILLFYGVDDVTFRDFGLLMSALALFLLSVKKKLTVVSRDGRR